jgi:hypothetical protein
MIYVSVMWYIIGIVLLLCLLKGSSGKKESRTTPKPGSGENVGSSWLLFWIIALGLAAAAFFNFGRHLGGERVSPKPYQFEEYNNPGR